MTTANLHRTHEVGHVVRLPGHGTLLRVARETGQDLHHLPGGAGVREVELEPCSDERTTAELARLTPEE